MLFAGYVLHAVFPVSGFVHLSFEGHHFESLVALHTGTNVGTVTATQAVEHVNLLNEVHTLHGGRSLHFEGFALEAVQFFVGEYERTDGSVRTYEVALVTLDTVFFVPYRNECSHTALFVSSSTLFPSTVFRHLECANGEQVAVLSIDGAYEVRDVSGFVAYFLFVLRKVCPCGVDSQLLVFAAAVNSLVVLVDNVLTLLAIRLHDELLHLLNGQINGDYLGDAEEGRLKDGVRTVAEADFLGNLGCVDIVNGNVVLSKVALGIVGQVGSQLVAFPNGVEQEGTVVAQTAKHVVHVQISLNVASHEVRGLNLIGRTDGGVAETEV